MKREKELTMPKVMCMCGHDVHYEMPYDDFRVVRIQCGRSCKAHRLEERVRQLQRTANQPLQTPLIMDQMRREGVI